MKKISFDDTESEYTIRFATKDDITDIMKFIKEYWSETHILANSREMFEYQYVYGEEVCFVISVNKETKEIEGVLGYIPYETEGERDIFTALWKVRKGKNLFQGIDLLYYLEEHARCRDLFCAGINPKTFSIYKYMGKVVTKMQHFYILNESCDYRVAKIFQIENIPYMDEKYTAKKIKKVDELQIFDDQRGMQSRPYKGREYIDRRFFHHIVYTYDIYEVTTNTGIAYVVGREQQQNGSVIFRIVDMWGEKSAIMKLGAFLHALLLEKGYEYMDCYAYGLDEILQQAGMRMIQENDENIIPNYFEPFIQENVDIHIFVPRDMEVHMLKGDGDQDRPNFI